MLEVRLIVPSHVPSPAAYAILVTECTHPRHARCDSFAARKTVLAGNSSYTHTHTHTRRVTMQKNYVVPVLREREP